MSTSKKSCRFCGHRLTHTFCNLGKTPLSNSYLKNLSEVKAEASYPLHAYVCESCFLVQLEEFEKPENIFSDYAYFSSYSDTWLQHCKQYAEKMISELKLSKSSRVVEIASNDGYLLQFFKEKAVPILGVEPAKNVAETAIKKGIDTKIAFFGSKLAAEFSKEKLLADLIIANNVLAHVPNLNDFVKGLKILLKPTGVITIEFPHLLRLMQENQFDTIYHEHFSYFSFSAVEKVFAHHGLTLFDVDELTTHGGSLRIYAKHQEDSTHKMTKRVLEMKELENRHGLNDLKTYLKFNEKIKKLKESLRSQLLALKKSGKSIVAYGAPAKGNTLLNYCQIGSEMIDYTVDRSPHKQGRFLPGTHLPIYHPDQIKKTRPEYVVLLPWNLKEEIMAQLQFIHEWGGKFIIPIPEPMIIE